MSTDGAADAVENPLQRLHRETCLGQDSNWANILGKLVLHRGWHILNSRHENRPYENTLNAYVEAAKAGAVAFECDVWCSQDSQLFLYHDSSVEVSGSRVVLADLLWDDISAIKLPDGSSPPLLSQMIDSVASPDVTLYVELKSQKSAMQLAQIFKDDPQLLLKMNFIFVSFSLISLKIMRQSFQPATPLRLLWLVDNPHTPYSPESLDEGELTFDICRVSFEDFLITNGLLELFLEVSPDGLGIQYNKTMGPDSGSLLQLRSQLEQLLGVQHVFLFIYADSDAPGGLALLLILNSTTFIKCSNMHSAWRCSCCDAVHS